MHHKIFARCFLLLLFLGLGKLAYAQTTLWSEDFETGYSDNDVTAQDNNSPSGVDWTTSGTPTDFVRVEENNPISGTFSWLAKETDNVITWTSESISISGYTNVSISIDLNERNCEGGDQIETFYNIGGGNVEFGDGNGDGDFNNVTNSVSGLSGTTLTIVVTVVNDANNERIRMDNISVTGTLSSEPDGPGGIGNSSATSAMVFWLDANQGVTTSGTAVTQWDDQSGNGNNASPPAAANQPTFDATGTNSHPVITFDGSTDYLTASDDNSLDLTTWSIIVVAISNLQKNYNAFVVKGSDATENYEFLTNFPSTGNFHYPVYYTTTDRTADAEPDESISTSVYGVYQLDYDQSNFEFFINGNQTETDPETRTPQTNSNELYIGNEEGTSGRNANASIGEIIIYNSPLNDAERIILHNAMSAKYGVSLSANDEYDEDDAGFDFDVAGIGQAADGSSHQDAQGTGIVRINTPSGLGNSEYLIWGHDNGALSAFGVSDLPSGVESRLARIWRASESGEVGTVTISFDLTNVAGSITASDLRLLIDSDNDGLFSDESGGSVISGATNTSGNIYEWTGVDIDDNERFTIGSVNESQTPLPITLRSFQAKVTTQQEIALRWITESEINNDYYTVERSNNGNIWEEIGKLKGAGTISYQKTYDFVDEQPYSGYSLYRIKQTDFDGNFSYTNVQQVFVSAEQIRIFPNPAKHLLTIDGPEEELTQIQLFSPFGQSVIDLVPIRNLTNGELQLNLRNLKSGIYLLKTKTQSFRFIKN